MASVLFVAAAVSLLAALTGAQPSFKNLPEVLVTATTGNWNGALVSYTNPTAEDAHGDPLVVTCIPPSGSTFVYGRTAVNCSAIDRYGNRLIGYSSVVLDYSSIGHNLIGNPPVPFVLHHYIKAVGGDNQRWTSSVYYTLNTRTDLNNEDGFPCTPNSGSTFFAGQSSVTCQNGNYKENFIMALNYDPENYTPPTFTRTYGATVTTQNPMGGEVAYTMPEAKDALDDEAIVSCIPPPNSFFSLGNTAIKCSALDKYGNRRIVYVFINMYYINPSSNDPIVTFKFPEYLTKTTLSEGVVQYPEVGIKKNNVDVPGVTADCTPRSGSKFYAGLNTVTCSYGGFVESFVMTVI